MTAENIYNSEIINAIRKVIDEKIDNPEVIRRDPSRGSFVLDDAHLSSHSRRTDVEAIRYPDGCLIRFVEHFQDATPQHKCSVLVYDYDINPEGIILGLGPIDDISPFANERLGQLLQDVSPLPPDEDELMRYSPSELNLQRILDSIKTMKIFIDGYLYTDL